MPVDEVPLSWTALLLMLLGVFMADTFPLD